MESVALYKLAPYGRWFFEPYWNYRGNDSEPTLKDNFNNFVHEYLERDDQLFECLEQLCCCLVYDDWVTLPRLKMCFDPYIDRQFPVCNLHEKIYHNIQKYITVGIEKGLIDVFHEFLTIEQKYILDTKL